MKAYLILFLITFCLPRIAFGFNEQTHGSLSLCAAEASQLHANLKNAQPPLNILAWGFPNGIGTELGGSASTRTYNANRALTLTAAGGNSFRSWSGCDSVSGTTCNLTMSADRTVTTADVAAPVAHILTVASSDPASGASIAMRPADNNSQSNGTTQFTRVYNNGTPMTLVAAVTAGGNRFSSWSGCDGSSGNYCNVTMSADKTVTATYTTLPSAAAWVVEPNQYGRLDVRVTDQAALDALLQSKWAAMKAALRAGDTAKAVSYFTKKAQAEFKKTFDNITIPYSQIDSYLGNITWIQQSGVYVYYQLDTGGTVTFQLEQDNEWRIEFF